MKKAKSLPKVKKDLQIVFNAWIRLRDQGKPCISCGQVKDNMQAGHFYPTGGYDGLRFDPDNCHLECQRCNLFDDSHLIGYAENLPGRIGIERYNTLKLNAKIYKSIGQKFSRVELMEAIEFYKKAIKDFS